MSLKVKQIRVGPTFISSTKDVVVASNCYVHCFFSITFCLVFSLKCKSVSIDKRDSEELNNFFLFLKLHDYNNIF